MTKDEYLEFHKRMTEKMFETTKKKNSDYTGKGDDPFANFSRVEMMGICNTEQGFLVRMMDKMSRLSTAVSGQTLQVSDESFIDSCLDLSNYAILMAAYHQSKKGTE